MVCLQNASFVSITSVVVCWTCLVGISSTKKLSAFAFSFLHENEIGWAMGFSMISDVPSCLFAAGQIQPRNVAWSFGKSVLMLSWLLLFRFLFPCLGNSLAQVWSANCSKKVWTHFNLPNQFSMFSRFFNLLNVFHFLLHWILLSFSVWLDDGLLPSLKASCLDLIMFESWLDKVPNCRKSSSENYRSKESFGLPKASCACWNFVAACYVTWHGYFLDFASFLSVFYWFECPSCVLCCLIQSLVIGLRELDQSLSMLSETYGWRWKRSRHSNCSRKPCLNITWDAPWMGY